MISQPLEHELTRCGWVSCDPLYIKYHDHEWGVPVYNERKLFEFLILEGVQAGLNWLTVLKKRAHYRACCDRFNPHKIAAYDQKKLAALLRDPGLIRNRLKMQALITNAQAYLSVREQYGSFKDFIWQFVDGQPQQNQYRHLRQVPTSTPASDAMARTLKHHGFKFVGTTICYAFMQAVGMVNDHTTDCFRHAQLNAEDAD